jgi:hypothetical protein
MTQSGRAHRVAISERVLLLGQGMQALTGRVAGLEQRVSGGGDGSVVRRMVSGRWRSTQGRTGRKPHDSNSFNHTHTHTQATCL